VVGPLLLFVKTFCRRYTQKSRTSGEGSLTFAISEITPIRTHHLIKPFYESAVRPVIDLRCSSQRLRMQAASMCASD